MNAHGGKRHKHVPPALSAEQVATARQDYAQGVPYKVLERTYRVSRYTLSRAIHGRDAYPATRAPSPKSRGRRKKPSA